MCTLVGQYVVPVLLLHHLYPGQRHHLCLEIAYFQAEVTVEAVGQTLDFNFGYPSPPLPSLQNGDACCLGRRFSVDLTVSSYRLGCEAVYAKDRHVYR